MRSLLAASALLIVLHAACGSSDEGQRASVKTAEGNDAELSLARSCVAAGEEQVLRVRAEAGTIALFEASYADGKSGAQAPFGGAYGGNDSEIVPKDGVLEMEWEISSEAPAGPVEVDVSLLTTSGQVDEKLNFKLATKAQSCP